MVIYCKAIEGQDEKQEVYMEGKIRNTIRKDNALLCTIRGEERACRNQRHSSLNYQTLAQQESPF